MRKKHQNPKPITPWFLEISVYDFDLDIEARLFNILKEDLGVYKLGQLSKISAADLMKTRGFGASSREEIDQMRYENKIALEDDLTEDKRAVKLAAMHEYWSQFPEMVEKYNPDGQTLHDVLQGVPVPKSQESDKPWVYNIPLNLVKMKTQMYQMLSRKAQIHTIGDLSERYRNDLTNIPYFGKQYLYYLDNLHEENALLFKDDSANPQEHADKIAAVTKFWEQPENKAAWKYHPHPEELEKQHIAMKFNDAMENKDSALNPDKDAKKPGNSKPGLDLTS